MSKTRVVEIIESLSDGGAQSIVKDYATLIDKKEFDLVIFTIYPCTYSANYKQVIDAGVKVVSVYKTYNIWNRIINRICKRYYINKSLSSFIKTFRPDAIHVHSVMLGYLAASSDLLNHTNIFYTCHSLPFRYFGKGHEEEYEAAKKLVENNNMAFIALHDEMRTELNKMFSVNNTVVLKNGVNFLRFCISESNSEIRESISIPADAFLVGHIGRFADMKNHSFLIDVFSRVLTKKPNAMLLLIGDGELQGKIKEKVNRLGLTDKVVFLSHRTDIPRLLKAMDVFVFPSIYEGLPVSIVESQIAGIRTITSDSVTHECFYKPSLIPLSLKEGEKVWADAIINESLIGPYDRDINEFNMAEVVRSLELMYKS